MFLRSNLIKFSIVSEIKKIAEELKTPKIYDEKLPIADDKYQVNGVCYITFPDKADEKAALKIAKKYLIGKYGNKVNINYFDKKSTLGLYTESFNSLMSDPDEYAVNYMVEK